MNLFSTRKFTGNTTRFLIAFVVVVGASRAATAQVAGSTTNIGVSVVESTRVALGWSVKKSIFGKTVFNDLGEKIGKVEDLIIAPDRSISYLIVGAGGFIGLGRHDVAIPMTQIQDKAGKLVLPGATKQIIKGLARFDYANDNVNREQLLRTQGKTLQTQKSESTNLRRRRGRQRHQPRSRWNNRLPV